MRQRGMATCFAFGQTVDARTPEPPSPARGARRGAGGRSCGAGGHRGLARRTRCSGRRAGATPDSSRSRPTTSSRRPPCTRRRSRSLPPRNKSLDETRLVALCDVPRRIRVLREQGAIRFTRRRPFRPPDAPPPRTDARARAAQVWVSMAVWMRLRVDSRHQPLSSTHVDVKVLVRAAQNLERGLGCLSGGGVGVSVSAGVGVRVCRRGAGRGRNAHTGVWECTGV